MSNFFKYLWNGFKIKGPSILTGIAIGGVGLTGYLSAKAGYKSYEDIDFLIKCLNDEEDDGDKWYHCHADLPFKTKFDAVYKNFIPAFTTGGLTIGCIALANKMHLAKETALVIGYELSQGLLKKRVEATRNIVGDDKADEIESAIIKDRVTALYENSDPMNYINVSGEKPNVIIIDPFSGVTFRASRDDVDQAINRCNARLTSEMWMSLEDIFDEISPKIMVPPACNIFGFESNGRPISFRWGVTKLPDGEIAHAIIWSEDLGVSSSKVVDRNIDKFLW